MRCEGERLYTGYARDVLKRFKEHKNRTGARFTKAFPPLSIQIAWEFGERSSALKWEHQLKKLRKEQKELLLKNPNHLAELREDLTPPLGFKKDF